MAAAEADGHRRPDLVALSRLLVAAVDGLIIQYEVHQDSRQARADLELAIRAASLVTRQGGMR